MDQATVPWDYLVVTASNEAQARAYESQLRVRQQWGYLSCFRQVLVVADPEGKRVGSGGSTIECLIQVVNREISAGVNGARGSSPSQPSSRGLRFEDVEAILRHRRILIIHAGGDSRRLPAYGPCGKIFIPVPGESPGPLGGTLFDRIAPAFLSLPPGLEGGGQVVMAAGDALILFDPSKVTLDRPGLTALACLATPEEASKHGVFCPGNRGRVRLYLQKPGLDAQRQCGAINSSNQSLLDIGIMSFDSTMVTALFRALGVAMDRNGLLAWPADTRGEVLSLGLDFYREICCALGEDATADHHLQQALAAGSRWKAEALNRMFEALASVPCHLQTVPQARFLHFGTTRQLITSGLELRQYDQDPADPAAPLSLNNKIEVPGAIVGRYGWVEGCRLRAPLHLADYNVVIGVEVDQPLELPAHACLDVLQGRSRVQQPVWYIRCYGVGDTFKDKLAQGATFCGLPLRQWLTEVGAQPEDFWDNSLPLEQQSLWDARVFPAESAPDRYRQWLWMYTPAQASPEQKLAYLAADRYSAAEIALLADPDDFFDRRQWPGVTKSNARC